jgi:hypothetical protein
MMSSMWKVLLCFAGHRVLLLATALIAVQFGGAVGAPKRDPSKLVLAKVASLPEAQRVEAALPLDFVGAARQLRDPYLLLHWAFAKATKLPVAVSLLFFANLVFLFFLWELHALVVRRVMPEIADAAVLLAILWPSSYEFSLGAPYGFTCLMATLAFRHGFEDRWWAVGPALALLFLAEPWTVGLAPVFLLMFWQSQRHYPWPELGPKLAVVLGLPALAIAWRWSAFAALPGDLSGSALSRLFDVAVRGQSAGWTFTHSYLGQTISIAIFAVGALCSLGGGTATVLQRLVPLYLLMLVLAFTDYQAIASRILLAAPALQGLASHAARPILGFVHLAMLTLGLYEVFALFAG